MTLTENGLHLENELLRKKLEQYKKKQVIHDLDKKISETLYQLRIPASIKGFPLLKEAIKNIYMDHTTIDIQFMMIYQELADTFNKDIRAVERAMRHAIESGWNKSNKSFKILNKYLEDKPNNSEFLALAVNYLRMNHEET